MSRTVAKARTAFAGHSGRMLALLTAGLTTAKYGKYILPPLVPTFIEELAISPFEAGVLLSVLSLCYAVFQYPGGRVSDQLSRRLVLGVGLGVLAGGFALLSVAPAYAALLAGAMLIGTGQGLYGPADRALLSDLFEPSERGRAFGINVVGTELGGAIAAGLSVAALALGRWRLAFVAGFLAAVGCLVLVQRWSRESLSVKLPHLGVAATARRLAKDRDYLALLVVYCLFSFIGNSAVGFLPTFLVAERGAAAWLASAAFAAFFVVGMVVKPVAGGLSDRFPRVSMAAAGLALGAVGLALLAVGPSLPVALFGVVLYAVGHRSFPPVMQSHLMERFPDDSMGGDLGATRTVYIGVGSLGPVYVGYVAGEASYTQAYVGLLLPFVVAVGILLWRA